MLTLLRRTQALGIVATLAVVACTTASRAKNELYVKTFGDPQRPAVVFVHGGPGYNSADFEVTTAQRIASLGFFVVTYDQRGQGRSGPTVSDNYNYTTYAEDLFAILQRFGIKAPILLASSHGGPIALNFEQRYPKVARAIVLQSAPIDFWKLEQDAYENCAARYRARKNAAALAEITQSFRTLTERRANAAETAAANALLDEHIVMRCRLLQTRQPSVRELRLRKVIAEHPSPMERSSTRAFLRNENFIYRNYTEIVRENRSRIYGIYGDEDGLYSPRTLNEIKTLLSPDHFYLIRKAAHGVYIDQPAEFLRVFQKITTRMN
ncbi:MAG TPA: alpha/beta hydrolase [Bdellovibrionota bacterium]|jgi:proline iminopeptidase|nr:alpha/beta hydrolase [Bdellovibrionota bacterium]